jgi:hypothetical protein
MAGDDDSSVKKRGKGARDHDLMNRKHKELEEAMANSTWQFAAAWSAWRQCTARIVEWQSSYVHR